MKIYTTPTVRLASTSMADTIYKLPLNMIVVEALTDFELEDDGHIAEVEEGTDVHIYNTVGTWKAAIYNDKSKPMAFDCTFETIDKIITENKILSITDKTVARIPPSKAKDALDEFERQRIAILKRKSELATTRKAERSAEQAKKQVNLALENSMAMERMLNAGDKAGTRDILDDITGLGYDITSLPMHVITDLELLEQIVDRLDASVPGTKEVISKRMPIPTSALPATVNRDHDIRMSKQPRDSFGQSIELGPQSMLLGNGLRTELGTPIVKRDINKIMINDAMTLLNIIAQQIGWEGYFRRQLKLFITRKPGKTVFRRLVKSSFDTNKAYTAILKVLKDVGFNLPYRHLNGYSSMHKRARIKVLCYMEGDLGTGFNLIIEVVGAESEFENI